MKTSDRSLNDAELLNIRYTFKPKSWAKEVIETHTDLKFDKWQLDYLADTRKRIALNCSRQSGKSTMTAVMALHMAIYNPKSMTLLISSTLNQSIELFYRIKSILKDLGRDAPRTVVDNKTSLELVNGSRIKCAPDTDNIRGITADLVVLDEAAYINKDIMQVVSPMLLTTNGRLVVISTPAGKTGLFWQVYNDPLYSTYSVPVTDIPRLQTPEKLEMLQGELNNLGSRIYGQEYLCQFLSDLEGSVFKRSWFDSKFVDAVPQGSYQRLRGWDMAATAEDIKKGNDPDWTSGTRMARDTNSGRIYIEDVSRLRGTPFDVERLLVSKRDMDGPEVGIRQEQEPGSAGKTLTAAYSRTIFAGYDYRAIPAASKGNKMQCAAPFAAACERGDVYIVRGDWNRAFIDELCEFPLGKHDDQVDSSSLTYNQLTLYQASSNVWFV